MKPAQGDRPRRQAVHGFGAYLLSEGGASASEYALMLMVLGGCGLVLMHAIGRHMDNVFLGLAAKMAAH